MAILPYKSRDLVWIGSSREELSAFPKAVRVEFGVAIRIVQNGGHPEIAAPLTGLSHGVYELKCRHQGEAYRTVYVVRLRKGIYVLDAFHKKSKSRKAIPREIMARIVERLKTAQRLDAEQDL